MATASVIIHFEASTKEEIESKIAEWNLHEGCQVTITITEGISATTGVVDSSSNLVVFVPEVPDEQTG